MQLGNFLLYIKSRVDLDRNCVIYLYERFRPVENGCRFTREEAWIVEIHTAPLFSQFSAIFDQSIITSTG